MFISGFQDNLVYGINPDHITSWLVSDNILSVHVTSLAGPIYLKLPEQQSLLDYLVEKSLKNQQVSEYEQKQREAYDLYPKVMITDISKPCEKCQFFDDSDDAPVCKKQIPPFYRGDYRIRDYRQDSCNSFCAKDVV